MFWPRGVRCCGPCLKVHAVKPLEEELKHVPLEGYEIWHNTNKVKVDIGYLTKEIKEHIKEDNDYISIIKADRCKTIEEKLDGMCQEVDENGNVEFNREVLNRCNSLKNSINLSRPFNEKC
ncbi:hypothetical protein C2G38_2047153 [Gigaspora rosea]|uniref:Uncharacterized protein n=1 Tax=Gigaspora rosea TaxID=44941 RepID=A0A397U6Y6_9GLOM|nr:hypothetical protein C2G38_2047153 [Gigaspora rosea]